VHVCPSACTSPYTSSASFPSSASPHRCPAYHHPLRSRCMVAGECEWCSRGCRYRSGRTDIRCRSQCSLALDLHGPKYKTSSRRWLHTAQWAQDLPAFGLVPEHDTAHWVQALLAWCCECKCTLQFRHRAGVVKQAA
jgi:hypothetical protein